MSRRLYIGRESLRAQCRTTYMRSVTDDFFNKKGLPPDARSEEVSELFGRTGRVVDCRIMNG